MSGTTAEDLRDARDGDGEELELVLSSLDEMSGLTHEIRQFDASHNLHTIKLKTFFPAASGAEDREREFRLKELFGAIGDMDTLKHLSIMGVKGRVNIQPLEVHPLPLHLLITLLRCLAPRLKSLILHTGSFVANEREFQEVVSMVERAAKLETFSLQCEFEVVDEHENLFSRNRILEAALKHETITKLDTEAFLEFKSRRERDFTLSTLPRLFASNTIRDLDICTVPVYWESTSGINQSATEMSVPLLSLRCIHKIEDDSSQDLKAEDNFVANALRVNPHLKELKMTLIMDFRDPDIFLLQIAGALSQSENSSLNLLHTVATDEHDPFSTKVLDAFGKMLRSNYELQILNFVLFKEDYNGSSSQVKTPEIDFYLRLNRHGRKHLMKDPQKVPRSKWVDTFVYFKDDLDAVFYYIQANPWLLGVLRDRKRPPISAESGKNNKRPKTD